MFKPSLIVDHLLLEADRLYTFALTVTSKRSFRYSTNYQAVQTVIDRRHVVGIACVKNCKHRLYTVDRLLHLKALCSTCQSDASIKHTWLLLVPPGKTEALGQDHRLVLTPEWLATLSGDRVTISMTVEHAGRNGTAGIDLVRHPPSSELFSVTPSTGGLACETQFLISNDRRVGIEARYYTVNQGEHLLAFSPALPFSTFLLDSQRYSAQITVRAISDEAVIVATTVTQVSVAACPQQMDSAAKIRDFLAHIATLGRNGDIAACLVHLHSAVPHMKALPEPERTEIVGEALRICNTLDLPGPVQHAYMIVDMVATLVQITEIRYELSVLVTHTLRKVVGRMVDMQLESLDARFWHTDALTETVRRILATFEHVTRQTLDSRMTFYVSDEQIPIPVEHPYEENYPDYADVSNTSLDVLAKLEGLQTAVQNIEDVIAGLAALFDQEMEPMEPEFRSQVGDVTAISVAEEPLVHSSLALGTTNKTTEVSTGDVQGRKSTTIFAFRSDPIWWYPAAFPVGSDVVWVYVSDSSSEQNEIKVRSSTHRGSLNILFRMRAPTSPPPTDATVIRNGHDMPVYTIIVPANGILHIAFTLPSPSTVLRLRIQPSSRMTRYEFERSHQRISANEIISWSNRHETARVLYMALMATATDDSERNSPDAAEEIIDFQFSTQIRTCRMWTRTDWQTEDCRLGSQSNRTHLHCVCRRRSGAFAAQLYVAPNQLVLPRDLQLSLTDNWLMLGVVAMLLLVLGCGLVWARRADRRHAQLHQQLHLLDPEAATNLTTSETYQITVCTGIRPQAGTTATITLRLCGTQYSTGPMQLPTASAVHLRPFRRGAVVHYRLQTAVSFGRLLSATVAHNSAGSRPAWFCDWIRVRDLQHREDWLFRVHRWLSLVLDDGQTSVTVAPIGEREFRDRRRLFRVHWRQSLVGGSPWYALLVGETQHGDGRRLTRVQRILVAAVSLACSLLTNVMFFGRTSAESVELEQRDKYARLMMSVRVLMVGVQSAAIAMVLTMGFRALVDWSAARKARGVGIERNTYRMMFAETN